MPDYQVTFDYYRFYNDSIELPDDTADIGQALMDVKGTVVDSLVDNIDVVEL